jgi:sulfatase modifying factor 1
MNRTYYYLLICALLFSAPQSLKAQQDTFKPYRQSLPGVDVNFDMVAIPAGKFNMGSPESEKDREVDEGPVHEVKLNAFWMSKYEIPWDIYELFVSKAFDATLKRESSNEIDAVTRPTPPYLDMTFGMGKEGHPAVGMTQYNAIQFCKWLYSRTGVFYRLPTEAEWEYACRAGSAEAFSFGNNDDLLNEFGWFALNSNEKTQTIGTKKPNAWGLHDMHGNVAEWTMDQYVPESYKKFNNKVADNPVETPVKLYPHAVRGGSYKDASGKLRSANREVSEPGWKRNDPQIPKSNWWFQEAPFIGVRIVRPLNTPSKAEIDIYYDQKPIPDYN